MPMTRQHEVAIDKFLKTNAAKLAEKLSVSGLILKLYANSVINKFQRDSLQARKKHAGWSEREMSEDLLGFLDGKSPEQRRKFLELVGEEQRFLVQKVVDELALLDGEVQMIAHTQPVRRAFTVCVHACVLA